MTHLPTAPPARPPAATAPPHPHAPPGSAPGPEPPRRSAFADGRARLRAAARTEPGRLRIIGAVVAGLLVLFGAVTAWQVSARSAAADTVVESSQPLSADAAEIYRSLADANTMAATGFLAGADEDPVVRDRYEEDVERAGRLLAEAAAHGSGTGSSQELIERLSQELPVYTGLVETARANNRQGFPLGGAYLRYADERMQEMLPLAEDLYELETARLRDDFAEATAWPWLALGTGVAALLVLGWAQRRGYRRTNRVFNPGLLGASAATLVLLVWLAGSQTLARGHLSDADAGAAESLGAINAAWTESLKARGFENLWLVARGAGDEFEQDYQEHMTRVAGDGEDGGPNLLEQAADLADDAEGRQPVRDALDATADWRERHESALGQETSGEYDAALELVIGAEGSTGEAFDAVDESLRQAVEHEQAEFDQAAESGRGALTGLVVGAAALAVLGAVGALQGIGRRLSEYR
ncbi:hypothetical protein [Streptomyces sp. B6B3]|uniref:hypothetical protein n=1 Tax=Streptomyces sp. B6B3 TaxID=3153570 RepID=UPI00325F4212